MILILGMLLVLGFCIATSIVYIHLRLVAIRWLFAIIVPYMLANGLRWIYLLRNGGCDAECDAWSLIPLGVLYLPGYVTSMIIVILTRTRHRIAASEETIRPGEPHALMSVRLREILGFVVAPLVSILLAMFASNVSSTFGILLGVYMLVVIFGVPTYILFRQMNWLKLRHFITAGIVLGIVLSLFLIWLINPNFWMLGQSWATRGDLLITLLFIGQSILISALLWLITFAPINQWFNRERTTEK